MADPRNSDSPVPMGGVPVYDISMLVMQEHPFEDFHVEGTDAYPEEREYRCGNDACEEAVYADLQGTYFDAPTDETAVGAFEAHRDDAVEKHREHWERLVAIAIGLYIEERSKHDSSDESDGSSSDVPGRG